MRIVLGIILVACVWLAVGWTLGHTTFPQKAPDLSSPYGRAPDGMPYCSPGSQNDPAHAAPSPSPCYFLGGRNGIQPRR